MKEESVKTLFISYRSFFLLSLNACCGAFFIGYKMAELNLMQTNLQYLYKWTESEKDFYLGLLTALVPIGSVFGSLRSGQLSNLQGKRKSFIISDLIAIFGVLLCFIKLDYCWFLIIGRFICGVAVGINCSLVPSYISEMAPDSIRGDLGSYFNTFIITGVFGATLVGFGIPNENELKINESNGYWRLVFLISIIPCFLRLFFLYKFYNFETIPFLLKRRQENEARNVIKQFYYPNNIESVLQNYKNLTNEERNISFKDLFHGYLKKRTYIGITLILIQTMSGSNAIIFYSSRLFKTKDLEPGTTDYISNFCSLLIAFVLILASYLSSLIVDKFGRKLIILSGNVACCINLYIIFVFMAFFEETVLVNIVIKITIFIFFLCYGMSLAPISWVYVAEILPEEGMSYVSVAVWLANAFLGFIFPLVISVPFIKTEGTFLFFGTCLLLSTLFIANFVSETKGKRQDEIERLFDGVDQNRIEMNYYVKITN